MADEHIPAKFFEREPDYIRSFHRGEFFESHLKIWEEGPIWVTQVRGYGGVDLVRDICRSGTEHGDREGIIVSIHDWYEVTAPDKTSRGILQDYSKAQHEKGQSREIAISCSSLLLKLSILAANIILGGRIEAFIDYQKFLNRFETLREQYIR